LAGVPSAQPVAARHWGTTSPFAEAVKSEIKDSGVTITLLMPGQVDTAFWHRAHMDTSRLGLGEKAAPTKVASEGDEAIRPGRTAWWPA